MITAFLPTVRADFTKESVDVGSNIGLGSAKPVGVDRWHSGDVLYRYPHRVCSTWCTFFYRSIAVLWCVFPPSTAGTVTYATLIAVQRLTSTASTLLLYSSAINCICYQVLTVGTLLLLWCFLVLPPSLRLILCSPSQGDAIVRFFFQNSALHATYRHDR